MKGVDFIKHAKEYNWVDSSLHLPVFSRMFNVNILWYDLEEEMAYDAIRKMVKDDEMTECGQLYCVEESKIIVHPKQMCQQSILEKVIVLLYHSRHYQNIDEYEIIDKGTHYEV